MATADGEALLYPSRSGSRALEKAAGTSVALGGESGDGWDGEAAGPAAWDWKDWSECCCFCLVGLLGPPFLLLLAAALCAAGVKSNTWELTGRYPPKGHFTYANMTAHLPPATQVRLVEKLFRTWTLQSTGDTFGYADVRDAPRLLYEGTLVEGVTSSVPRKLRGVFWLRGSGTAAALASLQYGRWLESEGTLLLPGTPFGWAFYGGSEPPEGSGVHGFAYRVMPGRMLIQSSASTDATLALVFGPCPGGGAARCRQGAGPEELTFATMQSHSHGDLAQAWSSERMVSWTLEEIDDDAGASPGSRWYRRCGVMCNCLELGSHELVKILGEDGEQLEPQYSEYLAFMRDEPLVVWSGFGPARYAAAASAEAAVEAATATTANG